MRVSIITISYNSAATIESTLQSVTMQNYNNIQYIVIDGGSTDGTLEIIEKYKDRIQHVVSEPDKGIYDAMNKGLALATGDITGILNSDDMYTSENVLSSVVKQFTDTDCDALYANLEYVDRENTEKVKRKWIAGKYSTGAFKKGWMPPHPTFFVKTELYKKYGVFNTALRSSADYELMLRFIHKHEIRITWLNQTIIKMRQGGQSNASVKNRLKANREDREAWRINGLKPGLFTLYLKPLRKLSQFWKR